MNLERLCSSVGVQLTCMGIFLVLVSLIGPTMEQFRFAGVVLLIIGALIAAIGCYLVIVGWDETTGQIHTTTWGLAAKHKEWAAQLGPILAAAAGGLPDKARYFEDFRSPSKAAEHAEIVGNIECLRQCEGDAVTIICDNPEGTDNDMQAAVDVLGTTTGFEEVRYYGKTWVEALKKAADAARHYYCQEKHADAIEESVRGISEPRIE